MTDTGDGEGRRAVPLTGKNYSSIGHGEPTMLKVHGRAFCEEEQEEFLNRPHSFTLFRAFKTTTIFTPLLCSTAPLAQRDGLNGFSLRTVRNARFSLPGRSLTTSPVQHAGQPAAASSRG